VARRYDALGQENEGLEALEGRPLSSYMSKP
jgi:hypothetical protein